ncbi:sulfotransferase [Synechococcus sp. CC9616]|uniref:sulfotransferase family protein n=1 Tax=Synechococcus sp. CC9616 TaxID=110663 RepID=UPI000490E8C0|nr:sulfotransferase [Synechococcus sp. CC9616]
MGQPTFLCIGGQRCGTTRLHLILSAHPQVLMTDSGVDAFNKEIHYFDEHVLNQPLSWYEAHFADSGITGEITPAYSALSQQAVLEIARYLPDLKIIFVVRHPLHRIWSQISMMRSAWGKNDLSSAELAKLITIAESPAVVHRSDYFRTISNWSAAFPPDQLLIITFDQLLQPAGLSRLLHHIGVNLIRLPLKSYSEKVLAAPKLAMPEELRWWIALRWLKMLRDLQEWGVNVDAWIDDLNQLYQEIPLSFQSQFGSLLDHAHSANQDKWMKAHQRDQALIRSIRDRLQNVQAAS